MSIDYTSPTPLFRQIAEDIKAQISFGKLKVGDQLPSQAELAREYGTSLTPVKKALFELIKDGFVYGRVGKGTFVASEEKSVDRQKLRAIGLVLTDLTNPFFSLIVRSIQEQASEKGYSIMLFDTGSREELEESQIAHFREIGVSGLIIASMSGPHRATPTLRSLQSEKYPFIMVSYVEDEDISYIGSDHRYGAFLATEHLIKLGRKRIGYLSGEKGNVLGELREEGYLHALEQHQLPVDKSLIYNLPQRGEWNRYQCGYEVGQLVASQSMRPDAIFAYNDIAALGFQQAVLAQGLNVPGDIALVGFDDIERDLYAPVPLTTVHQPTRRIGRMAVDRLIDLINESGSVFRIFLKPRLVQRESCGGLMQKTEESEVGM
ncbi:MAG: GntR family transcriptional regulator [Fidelibacterota bacterium]|nr:MAG: GntR family transcriptional regulator [Candidatus Neomarinimicrobiota bacterium]